MTRIVEGVVTGSVISPDATVRLGPLPGEYRAIPISPLPQRSEEEVASSRTGQAMRDSASALVETVEHAVSRMAPVGEAEQWCPPDYGELQSRIGSGTLAGVLQLLGVGAPEPFDLEAERGRWERELTARRLAGRRVVPAPIAPAPAGLRLWGVFESGETCWWLPTTRDPADWPVILVDADGVGWQRLEFSTVEFLDQWLSGRLDLPVLGSPPAVRRRTFVPAGAVMAESELNREQDLPQAPVRRDPLAQLATIIGAGHPERQRGHDWDACARALGLERLPEDYRRLLDTYGDYPINAGVFIVEPERLPEFQDEFSEYAQDSFNTSADEPLPVHPQPGGLLICATTASSGELWWDTSDPDPDRWTIIWDLAHGRHRFPGGLVELIVTDLTGRLEDPLTGLNPSMPNPIIE